MARRGRPPHPDVLTPAEWRVLKALRTGGTYVEVAVRLGLQVGTVKFHARNMRHKLRLETRDQLVAWRHEREIGGRRWVLAPLALFTGYLKPALSTAAVVVVGGAAITAGVLAYAIANTGEPTEDPATTATREEASPVAPSPTPSAPGSSGDLPAIHFWGDIPQSQQVAVRADTASIVEFFEERYGVRVPDLEVHVGDDDAALEDATESAEGARAWVGFALYRNGLLFVRLDGSASTGSIALLYFLALQDYLSQGEDWGPWWLKEGAAMYAAYEYEHERGARSLEEAMATDRWHSGYPSVRLDELEADSPTASVPFDANLHLATLAVSWLIQQGGEDSLVAYYEELPRSGRWTEAFEVAFGLPFSEVYSAFAAYRAEAVAEKRYVRGVVVGPDGKPVEDWRIEIDAFAPGGRGIADGTDADFKGDFTSRLPDGTYVLSLGTHCPGGWVELGWYGGEDGFTASYADATHVVVAGENVDGLVIRLPSLPDEMFPELCSYGPRKAVSGVVIGPDGEPMPNIYLASYDPVSSVWPDNTFSGADGSFTLSVPDNAAYRIDIARICEHDGGAIWSEVGEYGIEGDVPLDIDGLLAVASEDVAGVIMRLRVVYEDPGCLVYSPN